MSFVDNNGVKIHYEVEGEGPPLILHHGSGESIHSWQGYNLQLGDTFQLVFMDARGHGQSDKPHVSAAYQIQHMVGGVVAVLDHLNLAKVHFWGYSMGGKFGYAFAKDYPDRLRSLIIGGSAACDLPKDIDEALKVVPLFERGYKEGVEVILKELKASGRAVSPSYEKFLRTADLAAMTALIRHRSAHPLDLLGSLPAITVPCLVYAGDADEPVHSLSREHANHLPNATFYSLPGLKHGEAQTRSDLIVPPVKRFLTQIEGG